VSIALPLTVRTRAALSALLSDAIARAGLTQAEAARRIGVVPAAVSQWLSGDRELPLEALLYAARLLPAGQQARLIEQGVESLLGIRVRVELPGELVEAGDPLALIGALSESASQSIRAILSGIADGRIDAEERADLLARARDLRDLAARIEAVAAAPGRSSR
jgi:transcriptional regulator with XRE-family HTH domain